MYQSDTCVNCMFNFSFIVVGYSCTGLFNILDGAVIDTTNMPAQRSSLESVSISVSSVSLNVLEFPL